MNKIWKKKWVKRNWLHMFRFHWEHCSLL